jgi:site-specific DNA-methyltransferase (adenine-specific)/adenine-specific DNA-methyltransferase
MTEQPNLLNTTINPKKGETNVEHYEFEPIKGYPMLQWKGKRPFTSTQFYPAQLREVYGESVDGWRNKIYWGDNLQVMSHLLRDFRGKISLVYIDPPFDSKADYKKTIELKGKHISNDHTSFEDKQYTDIWNNDEYLQFMYERLILIRELLSDQGSIYVHCDYRVSSYMRLVLDEVFGKEQFLNEIIWCFSQGAKSKRMFGRKHNTIFLYAKQNEGQIFNSDDIRIEMKSGKETFGGRLLTDEDGRVYRLVYGTKNAQGETKYYKYYLDEGKIPEDYWTDINSLQSGVSERVDYPTQKPEGLLERMIKASSNPGDIVFDCFMGSGTTQAVAMKLGRKFIGADINVGAIETTTKRLLSSAVDISQSRKQPSIVNTDLLVCYSGFEVFNVNHYDVFRNPIEAKDLLLDALEVQRLEAGHLLDGEKDGRMIKIMPVNRIATRADLSELIAGFDYKSFDRRQAQNPGKAVERITLVCMGHEPDLAANLKNEVLPYIIDVEVVDILRDKQDLQFKRDSEAKVVVKTGQLVIEAFYPMNLLQKLSLQKENVSEWREMVESIMVDWNYDGAVLQPAVVDIPEGNDLVKGKYPLPKDAGTIRVKITDLLSESLEVEVNHG